MNKALESDDRQSLIRAQFDGEQVSLNGRDLVDSELTLIPSQETDKVTVLKLYANKLSSEGIDILVGYNWKKLTYIDLDQNLLGDEAARNLTKAHFSNLEYVNLCTNSISAVGTTHLSKADWPVLQQIWLNDNDIRHHGVRNLNKGHWKLLRSYNIYKCRLSYLDIGLLVLAEFPEIVQVDIEVTLDDKKRFDFDNFVEGRASEETVAKSRLQQKFKAFQRFV